MKVSRDRLIELLKQLEFDYYDECATAAEDGYKGVSFGEFFADHLLANGVIVPPCKVEPMITVIKKPFHNRIEVVKNTRYEWNEAKFCFSEIEAECVESEWKALAEREGKG